MSPIDGIISEEMRYGSMPYVESGTNHQIFSDIVNSYGLAGCQDQAWCATYQFAMELQAVGKEQALRNWCMTDGYVGYSVFATRDKFKAKGKTGNVPRVGALVIFKRSHMGRVLSVNTSTFVCGEGNTSNRQFDRDGDACAVKTYSKTDSGIDCFCYIDYEEGMNANQIINSTAAVYQMAHNGRYRYGDSHATPPCADGVISCDRLVARALWNLGYQGQPAGGITVLNMESYLTRWGATKIAKESDIAAGDIVLMRQNGQATPTAAWHTFVVTAVTRSGSVTRINKYDMGSQERINSPQPFVNVPVNQWSNKSFYCAFRFDSYKDYVFTPSVLKAGTTGLSAYLCSEIMKARGYKGIKDQEIEVNFTHTIGDMAAVGECKLQRCRRGHADMMYGPYGAGEVGLNDWALLLGSGMPFHAVELPTRETQGVSVLLCQEILRARNIKGADGKDLELDRQWGPNTEYAVKQYQKARNMKQDGKVTYDVWRDMLGGI